MGPFDWIYTTLRYMIAIDLLDFIREVITCLKGISLSNVCFPCNSGIHYYATLEP